MSAPVNSSQGRKFAADVFRPKGPKVVQTGVAGLTGAAPAAVVRDINGQVDLTLPIRGFRFVIKGRVGVGTANYTSANPEALFNLLSKLRITGNFRGSGKTIVDSDLAALAGMAQLTNVKFTQVNVNGVELAAPGVPYAAQATLAVGNFDFIISFDYHLAPWVAKGRYEAGFLMRAEDWSNVNIHLEFPAIADNATNPLGVSAATTVTTLSALGSGAGTMTVDIYSLPVRMGKAAPTFQSGLCTRTHQQMTGALTAGNGTLLFSLDRKSTTSVMVKTGTAGSAFPFYKTLSDVVLNTEGIFIGTSDAVRDKVDWFAVRGEVCAEYGLGGLGGYTLFDFLNDSPNPDRGFPGDALSASQTFNLIGDPAGLANAQGSIIQEKVEVHPFGLLFG